MSEVSKLLATDETFREVADLLFGAGADQLAEIAKSSPDGADLSTSAAARKKKNERRQAQVGLASNVVGLAAGTQGLYETVKNPALKARKGATIRPSAFKVSGKTKALAAGAVGLQALNLGGDVVANRVLARSAKKQPEKKAVHKSIKDIPEVKTKGGGKLTEAKEMKPSKKVIAASKGGFRRLPDKVQTSRVKKVLDVRWEGEISKVNEDKQQVFGWASIVEVNGEPVVDLQGDYIAIEEVEKSAYEYVHKSRKGGDMHLRDEVTGEAKVGSHMIESFVITEDKKKALGMDPATPTGWWVGYQVNDPDLWSKVKSGERTGFSIHGRGVRSEMA